MTNVAKITESGLDTLYAHSPDGDEHLVQAQTWTRWRAVHADGTFGQWRASPGEAAADSENTPTSADRSIA